MSIFDNSGEIANINRLIDEENKTIADIYSKLGQLYYNKHKDDHEDCFGPMISAIKESQVKIENMRKRILDIRGVVICSKCGTEVSNNVAFCSTCGNKLKDIAPPVTTAAPAVIRCINCGKTLDAGMKFCTECGTAVAAPAAVPVAVAVAEEPVVVPPVVEEPVVVSPVVEEPVVAPPVVEEPVVAPPVAEEPVVVSPVVEEPVVVSPVVEEPVVSAPVQTFCPTCGAVTDGDMRFCIKCGTRLK